MLSTSTTAGASRAARSSRISCGATPIFGALQQRSPRWARTRCASTRRTTAPRRRPRSTSSLPRGRGSAAGAAFDLWTDEATLGFAWAQRVVWSAGLGGPHAAPGAGTRRRRRVRPQRRRWYRRVHRRRRPRRDDPGDGQWCSSRTAPSAPGSGARSDRAPSGTCPTRTSPTTRGAAAKPPQGDLAFPKRRAREAIDGKKYIAALRNIGRAADPGPAGRRRDQT